MKNRKNISKEVLYDLYIIQNKSIHEIAKILKCGSVTIWKRLKDLNISIKKHVPWNKNIPCSDNHKKKISKANKGKIPWNIGLTKETDGRVLRGAETFSKTHFDCSGSKNGFHNKHHEEETKKLFSLQRGGTGIPYEGKRAYSEEWTQKLKESIRQRDNYTCQLCGMTEEENLIVYGRDLEVHHIDYNKKNCIEDNLISLCLHCHRRTNYNRNYWIDYFINFKQKV